MPQYTTCVQPGDYRDPPLPPEGSLASYLSVIFIPLPLLQAVCDYMLRGKLVCLGGDQCAIGYLAGIETVADKSFPDTIDNDYSLNLALAPHGLAEFAHGTIQQNYDAVAKDGIQGELIREQPNMPTPRESLSGKPHVLPNPRYGGKFQTFPDNNYLSYDPSHNPFQVPGSDGSPFDVPVLHCEIEGDRTVTVCTTLEELSNPIPGFCHANAVFEFLCDMVSFLSTPFFAPALAAAWAAGSNDNRDFQGAGSLRLGDAIAIKGRWVYDAGHEGWNELHAVNYIQKVELDAEAMQDFPKFRDRCCEQISKVPPVTDPGVHPVGMTPAQQTVYDNQRQPENRWLIHPLIDGCEPADGPTPSAIT